MTAASPVFSVLSFPARVRRLLPQELLWVGAAAAVAAAVHLDVHLG